MFDCDGGLTVIDPESRKASTWNILGVAPAVNRRDGMLAFGGVALSVDQRRIFLGTFGVSNSELLTPGMYSSNPSWAPDGNRLVFECVNSASQYDLCVVNKDGSGLAKLTDDTFFDADPAWSPNGSAIAFTTFRFGEPRAIALITPGALEVTRLTVGSEPSWSRDGSKILFARPDGIFSIRPDGSELRKIVTGTYRTPVWRH